MHRTLAVPAAALLLATAGCGTPSPGEAEARAAAHVAVATQAASSDLGALMVLCKPPTPTRPSQADSDKGIAALIALPAPPPGRAFDNLYYVGAKWVSAWAIKTSAGIILIDALNNRAEAAALIEPGLRRLGMDPADIKYIVVTHGHGDHYGGVDYLVEKYHPRVVMSAIDWTMTETKLEFDTPAWDRPPKRDLAVQDGDRIVLGDTTVTLYVTPGHTLGAISPAFDVTTGGVRHRAMLWGGTAFNFGRNLPRLDQYIASTRRMADVTREQGVDVLISNHSDYDGSLAKLEQLRTQPAGLPNPFVVGAPTVLRALNVMGECAEATRIRYAAMP